MTQRMRRKKTMMSLPPLAPSMARFWINGTDTLGSSDSALKVFQLMFR